jgi:hypothetical protein
VYHYDPQIALEELIEEASVPNPVHMRDMLLGNSLTTERSLELNRMFIEYQRRFGEAQKIGRQLLEQLAGD